MPIYSMSPNGIQRENPCAYNQIEFIVIEKRFQEHESINLYFCGTVSAMFDGTEEVLQQHNWRWKEKEDQLLNINE
uniref:Uncharacterized protein n=1 Tax=Lepeophtheirus salmonis TaxID=72036 RepID=A0A0K2VKK0_LEPSM